MGTMKPATGLPEDDAPTTTAEPSTTMQSIMGDDTTEADQEFICTGAASSESETTGDVPMTCKHVDEEKTVMLIITKESLGDVTLDRLFDKNVKIVVKDFMIMDRSPRKL